MNVTPNPTPAPIKDSTDRAFKADVIDASKDVPVLVDFWAPWCGPCRALTPTIEKVVKEKAGKIRLVKINIDENPAVAGQLGVQSIPAVFAFAGGRPVDAFMGALPESEVRRFADKVIAAAPDGADAAGGEVKQALAAAATALAGGDLNGAAQIYGMVLQHEPENADATIGMARVFLAAGDPQKARTVLATLKEPLPKSEDYLSLLAQLKLHEEAVELSAIAELRHALERNADDHQARFDLALALNIEDQRAEAAEQLVGLMRRDRAWNDDGARKKLLEFFDAWGAKDPATLKGRRLLSSVLFS